MPVGDSTRATGRAAGRLAGAGVRLHWLLVTAAAAMPALLFAGAAWQNHKDSLREGLDSMHRTALVMREHARTVFETADLATRLVDERIDELTPEQVRASASAAYLRRLQVSMEQILSVWVTGPDGTIEAGSQPWRPGSSIADMGFFRLQRDADHGSLIGVPFVSRATGAVSIPVGRRRFDPTGQFAGTIHVSVDPGYFRRFYTEAAPPMAHVAALLLTDGAVLVREPEDPAEPSFLPAHAALLHAIGQGRASLTERDGRGEVWDFAIERLTTYPVAVVFAARRAVLMERWYRNLAIYGAGAALAALVLVWTAWLTLRSAMAEERAIRQLEHEARQREQTEQQLRHAQRLDAVGQLTGGVAHDFNNLLTAILGNLEMIQRAVTRPDASARIERLCATAIKAVQRGSSLTKSLLAFSRRQPLQPRPLDANAVLTETVELVRQALGAPIAVTFDPDPNLPHCVADPTELEAALLNLAINARDAMGGAGRLAITTGSRWLGPEGLTGNSEAKPGLFVAIGVKDEGAGMSAEVKAKAFEPFFTTKPIGSGTGLGLSQVFGFVRQLGGHVTLQSEPGRGTEVTLFLPVTR